MVAVVDQVADVLKPRGCSDCCRDWSGCLIWLLADGIEVVGLGIGDDRLVSVAPVDFDAEVGGGRRESSGGLV